VVTSFVALCSFGSPLLSSIAVWILYINAKKTPMNHVVLLKENKDD